MARFASGAQLWRLNRLGILREALNSMMPILAPGGSDIYCFDVAGTASNVIVNRALGSGNSGGVTATVSGLSGTGAIPSSCPSGTDVAAVGGVNGTSSFFMLVN